jgi:hypothetical protein
MKQLSKNEIIELRARNIFESRKYLGVTWEDLKTKWLPMEKQNCWSSVYYGIIRDVEAIIEADEKAGVLMLVDGDPEDGDLVFDTACSGNILKETIIIRSNNMPVYHCKKEG